MKDNGWAEVEVGAPGMLWDKSEFDRRFRGLRAEAEDNDSTARRHFTRGQLRSQADEFERLKAESAPIDGNEIFALEYCK